MAKPHHMTFRGIRGSMPVAGPEHARYGGHTTCIDVALSDSAHLVIDCGTGLRQLQSALGDVKNHEFHVLLTHYHWDHLQGLPFFRPLYEASNRFVFYGHEYGELSVADLVGGVFTPPWFPISLDETAASKEFVALEDVPFDLGWLHITPDQLHHPQGVTAYRLQSESTSIVIATDVEAGDPESDEALVTLAKDANVLIHDAQYLPDEYESGYRGWGHSTWKHATDSARNANVDQLILVSHEPDRPDSDIDEMVALARQDFPATLAGYEGMTLDF